MTTIPIKAYAVREFETDAGEFPPSLLCIEDRILDANVCNSGVAIRVSRCLLGGQSIENDQGVSRSCACHTLTLQDP